METLNYRSHKQVFIPFLLVSLFLYFNSCSSSNNAPPANEVFIQQMAFTPATIYVKAGTTVKWTNKDSVTHTVTSDTAGQFNSGNVPANGVFSFMFLTIGIYNYHCSIHPSMVAKIVVD